MTTKLSNEIQIYACSMGKVFRVTHVCQNVEEANCIMERDRDTALIAEDNNGFCYLAEQYGSVAPSVIMEDMRRLRA